MAVRFITAWCFFGLLMQINFSCRMLAAYLSAEPEQCRTLLFAVGLVFIIWQVVGLLRLRPFNRWFAVVFFIAWTVLLSLNGAVVMLRSGTNHAKTAILLLVCVVLDLLSAWYLGRRSFREFAVQYVTERESQMNQKFSKKKVLDEIHRDRAED